MDTGPEFDVEGVEATRFPEVAMARNIIDSQKRGESRKAEIKKRHGKKKVRHRKRPHIPNPFDPTYGGDS